MHCLTCGRLDGLCGHDGGQTSPDEAFVAPRKRVIKTVRFSMLAEREHPQSSDICCINTSRDTVVLALTNSQYGIYTKLIEISPRGIYFYPGVDQRLIDAGPDGKAAILDHESTDHGA